MLTNNEFRAIEERYELATTFPGEPSGAIRDIGALLSEVWWLRKKIVAQWCEPNEEYMAVVRSRLEAPMKPTERSLVDCALRERDAYMATIEGELQRNRATQLAAIVVRLLEDLEDEKGKTSLFTG